MNGVAPDDSTGRDRGAPLEENAALRAENFALRELCLAQARERQQAARCKAQLDEILGSRAWVYAQTARRIAPAVGLGTALRARRHHDGTVRSAFERAVELFEEPLRVKARIFESLPVAAGAISSSLARGFAEYVDRTRGLGPRPAMSEHPRLVPHLDRLRDLFQARLPARQDVRLLFVRSGVTMDPEHRELIRRANELSGRLHVFGCNALPRVLDPAAAARLDGRIIPLEGSLGLLPWSWDGEPFLDSVVGEATSSRRAEVICELIDFHRIDAIHSQGPWADRLLTVAGLDFRIAPRLGPPGRGLDRPLLHLDRLHDSGVYSRAALDRRR